MDGHLIFIIDDKNLIVDDKNLIPNDNRFGYVADKVPGENVKNVTLSQYTKGSAGVLNSIKIGRDDFHRVIAAGSRGDGKLGNWGVGDCGLFIAGMDW